LDYLVNISFPALYFIEETSNNTINVSDINDNRETAINTNVINTSENNDNIPIKQKRKSYQIRALVRITHNMM
jgi:hypothetical protein